MKTGNREGATAAPAQIGDGMRRRDVIAGLATLLVAPKRSSAQQAPAKLPRIGILPPAPRPDTGIFDAFRKGLADLGYIDGQNIRIEYRLSARDFSRLSAMAEELVRLPVDVILADGLTVVIAQEATRTIPIIGGVGPDPVAAGLIESFAHPGGNVTGFSAFGVELSAKRLQLLKEACPAISHVAALRNPAGPKSIRRATEEAACTVGAELSTIEVATPGQIFAGFEMAVAEGANALVVLPDAMFWNERGQIVALAAKYRMLAIYPEREYVDEGGLLAYGSNVPDQRRRRATYVDKILKGAKPGDLPIQQPVEFDFLVNLRTARELGLTIPPAILDLADEVIE
jgi:putative ABC transport system substrate-binding protein